MITIPFTLAQTAADLPPIAFDLAKVNARGNDCMGGTGDSIIVCGHRRQPVADPFATGPYTTKLLPKADFGLFGKVRANVHGDQNRIGGIPSNAVKATITIPF